MVNVRSAVGSLIVRLRREQKDLARRLEKVTRVIDALSSIKTSGRTVRAHATTHQKKWKMSLKGRKRIAKAKKAFWRKKRAQARAAKRAAKPKLVAA